MNFRNLSASPGDLTLLRRVYHTLYTDEFPDPNERESYENMATYLRAVGSHENGYHIVLAMDGARPIGASITDYFARSNAGVVEFIVIAPQERGNGLGVRLLRYAEEQLADDARRRGHELGFIIAEINDPFKRGTMQDNVDPFERARWWDRRNYGRLHFCYVQPALSAQQAPVRNLMLVAKRTNPQFVGAIPAPGVDAFVRDYLTYAMRICNPSASPEYREMARELAALPAVRVVPLRVYIGEDPEHVVAVHDVSRDVTLDAALSVYDASFPSAATALSRDGFRNLLEKRDHGLPFAYHLWALAPAAGARVAGMASFFTFATAGFGGYIALVPPLQGRGSREVWTEPAASAAATRSTSTSIATAARSVSSAIAPRRRGLARRRGSSKSCRRRRLSGCRRLSAAAEHA